MPLCYAYAMRRTVSIFASFEFLSTCVENYLIVERKFIMSIENLPICFPKQLTDHYIEYPSEKNGVQKLRYGGIPKTLIPSNTVIGYTSPAGKDQSATNVHYYSKGGITYLEESVGNSYGGVSFTKSQKSGSDGKLSVKRNRVDWNKEYSSTHTLNHKTGLESVVRKKDGKIIGGYKIKPVKRTFAGFKGRLQKLGMAVATDANGCERPVLKNVGEMFFKLAKIIK